MGGPAPAFSGRRSVGCAGYLTRESDGPRAAGGHGATLPLVGRVASEASGVGVEVERGAHSTHLNTHPHPDRLRFASAIDPPHKGEGEGEAVPPFNKYTATIV